MVPVHARGVIALFREVMDFMYLDGRGFAESGWAKVTEANIVELGPPPFGYTESTKGEKRRATQGRYCRPSKFLL